MRPIKVLGLAGLAALAVGTALVLSGVGSAGELVQKTVICKKEPNPKTGVCEGGQHFPEKTKIKLALQPNTKAELEIDAGILLPKLRCDSTGEGETKQEKGLTPEKYQLEVHITNISFTNCEVIPKVEGAKCTVHTKSELFNQLPFQGRLLQTSKTASGGGELVFYEQLDAGQPGLRVVCENSPLGNFDCIYKVNNTNSQVPGEGKAGIMLSETVGKEAKLRTPGSLFMKEIIPLGGACPGNNPSLSVEYTASLTPPGGAETKEGWVSHVLQAP